jgi:hypothetical protein
MRYATKKKQKIKVKNKKIKIKINCRKDGDSADEMKRLVPLVRY